MRVMVTGASGFVGQHLLNLSPSFIGVDKAPLDPRVLKCDLRNFDDLYEVVCENQISAVVHLAGVQYSQYVKPWNRKLFFQENVDMAQNLRRVSELCKIRKIIYLSTDMVYGDKITSPVNEEASPAPIGEYGASKLAAEEMLSNGTAIYKLVVLRPRLILGSGRAGTMDKLATLINSPLPIFILGDGKNRYQFVGVDDVCTAVNLFLNMDLSGTFNIGSNNPPELVPLFQAVLDSLNRRKMVIKIPSVLAFPLLGFLDKIGLSPLAPEQFRISDIDYVLDTSKLKMTTGWDSTQTDGQLLTSTIAYLIGDIK
jgi:dTDP-glucose 4,6-dehydratase